METRAPLESNVNAYLQKYILKCAMSEVHFTKLLACAIDTYTATMRVA